MKHFCGPSPLFFNVLKVQNTLFWAKITGRAHVRGGRGDFTEIKFDQIRSRCDKFGDFFAKILRFEGIFKVYVLSCFQNLFKFPIFFRMSANFFHFNHFFFNFLKVQNTLFWAKITGRAHVVDPGVEHEPRRFFDAFSREIKTAKIQDLSFRSKKSHF